MGIFESDKCEKRPSKMHLLQKKNTTEIVHVLDKKQKMLIAIALKCKTITHAHY